MIKMFFISILCFIKGHLLGDTASCPFTGKSYRGCNRCGELTTL